MNRLISQGHAIRSTRAFSRVTTSCVRPLLPAVGLVERGLEDLRQLHWVVVRPEVHVEEPGRVHERVVVDRCDVDALLPERLGHPIPFLAVQPEVAGYPPLSPPRGPELPPP